MPTIRQYRPEDRQGVIEVWKNAGLIRPQNDPSRDIDRKLAYDPEGFLVAEEQGKVIGVVMAGYEGHRGWLQYLGVDPAHQGNRIGRQLVEAAVELLRQRGAPKVNLQIRTTNAKVIAFYEHLGFRLDEVASMGLRLVEDEISTQ